MPVRAGLMRVTVRGYGPAAKALEQLAVSSVARGVHSIDSPAAPDNGRENALHLAKQTLEPYVVPKT